MHKPYQKFGDKPQENVISGLPARIAGMFTLLTIVVSAYFLTPAENQLYRIILAVVYGAGGLAYITIYHRQYIRSPHKTLRTYRHSIILGIGIGLLVYFIPSGIHYTIHTLIFVTAVSLAASADRGPSYLFVLLVTFVHISYFWSSPPSSGEWLAHIGLAIAALVAVETIQQLKNIPRTQLNRLEIVNNFSRKMISTLETGEIIAMLDAELKKLLKADTYFLGIQKGDSLYMELFHDDGQYYNGLELDMEGTLSKWVIRNNAPLFLPDLRNAVKLEGVTIALAGKEKTSLSWMGVPMKGSHANGLMAIASYEPNAFNRSDLELLSNIAQLLAFALDNSYQHAKVEEQASLDSLTRVYNHGYFIQTMQTQAHAALKEKQPLSLIMLDIDYFKHYNDTYGHLAGDEVLLNLCNIIRQHIKETDAVGRWGGEEFAISLPNSTGEQARQVALRIQESLSTFKLKFNGSDYLPTPTVSMGIAVFPAETDNINILIDLADKRLYTAKERGRDQIEAAP
jgi:diguanylate cyclase (GGDEF)-like protein